MSVAIENVAHLHFSNLPVYKNDVVEYVCPYKIMDI